MKQNQIRKKKKNQKDFLKMSRNICGFVSAWYMAPLSTYLHIINTFAYSIHHEEGIV